MSSSFPGGGGPDFYTGGGGGGRSAAQMMGMNNQQVPYRSAALTGILPDSSTQILHRGGADSIGKRSLAEFQQQQQLLQQQQFQPHMGLGGIYNNLRNVKPRVNYQHTSPISPLSPVDFSSVSSLTTDLSSISSSLTNSSPINPRYGLPMLQQQQQQQLLRPHQHQHQHQRLQSLPSLSNGNILQSVGNSNCFSSTARVSFPNLVQNQRPAIPTAEDVLPSQDQSEKKMLNQLLELEKQLLDDDDNENTGEDAVSAVTNSEWSETIQNLNMINSNRQQPISPSPTSSSSSCSSTSASPPITCPKQSITDAATAIAEGKTEVALEILTRLSQVSNARGTSEQRVTAYMSSALRSRVNPSEFPPPVNELYNKEHTLSTQMLYDASPCFKLGFMAANLAILDAISEEQVNKLHVLDFDIGQGGQYVHLLHALAARKPDKPTVLKITTFADVVNGGEESVRIVGDWLKVLANKIGVSLIFSVMNLKICELSREKLGLECDEALVVNFAFKLYKLPDESVTTENLRDELLRRVKALSPKVVTVVEQETNTNTAPFVARVNLACEYYGVLFESLEATEWKDISERVRIEEGLGRKMANSVAWEGRDRVERCEVFGKWRARMSMAGFESKSMSSLVADSLRSKLNSGTRGNPGFTVNEQSGGICFGWTGRTLTVASAWR